MSEHLHKPPLPKKGDPVCQETAMRETVSCEGGSYEVSIYCNLKAGHSGPHWTHWAPQPYFWTPRKNEQDTYGT